MKIGIIGLGYVGLPLAVAFADAGHEVVGLDLSEEKVAGLNSGRSYIGDVSDEELARANAGSGGLTATLDYRQLAPCDALIMCVPTPLTGSREPDLRFLESAADSVAEILRPGQLVSLESTTYPGSTRDLLGSKLSQGGMVPGEDFHLAFSPERIDPGRIDHTVRTTPKLVGGLTPACTAKAAELYSLICEEVVPLSTPEAAELAKLLENIFRSVNIALVNELAQLCERLGIDIWEVIDAASTKPFGFMRFEPGPGMGGHCLPVDPFYLAFKARENGFYPEFIELAGKVNQGQPRFCVERIQSVLNDAERSVKGSKVLIVGVSYKPGVGDTRESPSLRIIELLRELGAEVSYHDPHVPELAELALESSPLEATADACDIAAIVTAHPEVDHADLVERADHVIDFRGITRDLEAANVERL